MIFLVLGALFLALAFLPQIWVKYVMNRHHKEDPSIPGSGADLARHLITRFELDGIKVEQTQSGGDHFDPQARAVRLSPENYEGHSLTAVAVAAHEVGHAIQYHRNEPIFQLRRKYIPRAVMLNKIGVALMWSIPFAGLILRTPLAMGMLLAASIVLQLMGAMAYLIVLPEEWDASFNKAMPILIQGEYIDRRQQGSVRQVLRAAALTYFAAALANIFNIGRWLMVLRR